LLSIKEQENGRRISQGIGSSHVGILWHVAQRGRTEEGERENQALKVEFWQNVNVLAALTELNQETGKSGRVADFIELGE